MELFTSTSELDENHYRKCASARASAAGGTTAECGDPSENNTHEPPLGTRTAFQAGYTDNGEESVQTNAELSHESAFRDISSPPF